MEAIREEHERTLRSQRLDMETYLQLTGQTEQEWQTQLRPQAQDRLTTYLIIRKLAEQENIQVEPQEIEAEIQRLMQNSDQDSAANMRLILNSPDSRESIRSNLLGIKVMARLVEIVKGDPAPETPRSRNRPGNQRHPTPGQHRTPNDGHPRRRNPYPRTCPGRHYRNPRNRNHPGYPRRPTPSRHHRNPRIRNHPGNPRRCPPGRQRRNPRSRNHPGNRRQPTPGRQRRIP